MRCDGCGRLLAGKAEWSCQCWQSLREGATISARLRQRVDLARKIAESGNDARKVRSLIGQWRKSGT